MMTTRPYEHLELLVQLTHLTVLCEDGNSDIIKLTWTKEICCFSTFYFSVEKALFIRGGGVLPASYRDSGGGELKQHQSGMRPVWL